MPNQDQIVWIILGIWEMSFKGVAMWKAAQNKELKWYVAIFIINSLGLLPIFYLYKEKIIPYLPFTNLLKTSRKNRG